MVPGVVGRPSTAAAPAGRLRIAHCTGRQRRPQLVDRSLPRRTGPMSADEQGTNWRPPTERSVRRAHRIFSVTPATGCVTHVETRKGMSCRGALGGAEPIARGCRVNAVPLSDLLVSLPGDGFV